jgi:hypothetical protein
VTNVETYIERAGFAGADDSTLVTLWQKELHEAQLF